ncbi:Rieske 2Fe-2S domain-containing protein [Cupriavidus basilensis]
MLDELCPHRKTSLLMARNEDNGLRCIFHGWKLGTTGEVIEAPNHVGDQAQFCKHVRVNRYGVQERGGIVWVWLGKGEQAPKFPDLPFTSLPEDQRSVTSQEVPTNWVQGVEASMDSSHVGVLHESTTQITAGSGNQRMHMTQALAPRLEFEDRPYGYRYAALRPLPDDKLYARVNNFVMPWYGIICAPDEKGPSTVFFSTPVDDVTHRAWFVHFNPHRPLGMTIMSATPDVWNFPPLPPGTPADNWGQRPRPDAPRPCHRVPAAPGHRGLRHVHRSGPDCRPHHRAAVLGRRRGAARAPGAAEVGARVRGRQDPDARRQPGARLQPHRLDRRRAARRRRLAFAGHGTLSRPAPRLTRRRRQR